MRATHEQKMTLPSGLETVVSEYEDGSVRFKVRGAQFLIADVVLFGRAQEWCEVLMVRKES